MTKVRSHYRRTKKGKKTVVGRHKRKTKGKKKAMKKKSRSEVPAAVKKQVLKEYSQDLQKDLKSKKRAKLLDLGTISIKIKPAKKGGKKMYMPMLGKTITTKPKPKRAIIKFRAGKALKEKVA